ncbi:Isoprenylcysteine alpha-carbonyl methylesterase ICME [Glycine soja]|uniref:Isoprenylcysteine alpha-carbonyl methylesterase ICME n=1 Tax=Glycine soja TaxID=3848 RepID=A0A0B2RZ48_GLYSO|nr:Isoprenylcysteine alpha-carbonyl methylesterase ICME [Glycine soja]
MIYDASQGISFVCNNIAEYGGDPNRIYLMAWGSQLGHILLHVQLWSRQSKRQVKERVLLGVFPKLRLILVYLEGKYLQKTSFNLGMLR